MWGLLNVEADSHDLDCDEGHHTEGVLHDLPCTGSLALIGDDGRLACSNNSSVTTNSRSIKHPSIGNEPRDNPAISIQAAGFG
jgi:hypothetical protein